MTLNKDKLLLLACTASEEKVLQEKKKERCNNYQIVCQFMDRELAKDPKCFGSCKDMMEKFFLSHKTSTIKDSTLKGYYYFYFNEKSNAGKKRKAFTEDITVTKEETKRAKYYKHDHNEIIDKIFHEMSKFKSINPIVKLNIDALKDVFRIKEQNYTRLFSAYILGLLQYFSAVWVTMLEQYVPAHINSEHTQINAIDVLFDLFIMRCRAKCYTENDCIECLISIYDITLQYYNLLKNIDFTKEVKVQNTNKYMAYYQAKRNKDKSC